MTRQSQMEKKIRGYVKVYGLLFRLLWMTFTEWLCRLLSPRQRRSVAGKVVLITGASRGLGREMALEFAKLGAKVVLWSSKQENVNGVAEEVRTLGGQAMPLQCDVSKEEDVRRASKKVLDIHGHVDILINNAAVPQNKLLLETTSDDLRKIIDVNFMSNFWTMQNFLPSMIKRKEGQIVCINSILGFTPAQKASAYSATKAGLVNMMDTTESEILHTHPECKIHFTTIFPGVFLSGMVTKTFNKLRFLFPIVHAHQIAVEAVDAILKCKPRCTIPARVGVTIKLARFFLSENAYRVGQDFINYDVET